MPRFCHSCGAALLERGAFCPACGTPVQSRAAPARQDGHKAAVSTAFEADRPMRFRLGLAVAALGALLLGIIVVFANRSSSPDGGVADPTAAQHVEPSAPRAASANARMRIPPPPPTPIPSPVPMQQTAFTSTVASFTPSYEQADTEIRKTNVRFETQGGHRAVFRQARRSWIQGLGWSS
jgi:hypothetical protein